MRASLLLWSGTVAAALLPGGVSAQEPPVTLPPVPDSLSAPPAGPGTGAGPEGEVREDPEGVLREEGGVRLPPAGPEPVRGGTAAGTWVWEAEDLLDSRALTLAELLDRVPGMVPARGGDYGMPTVVGAFALGGGRLRVFRDGVEVLPLYGGVTDLSRIGLGGVGRVRLDRFPGEVRIHLESRLPTEPRPLSIVEAGTGDFDTNLFRGTFVHPSAGGGILVGALDRIDTRGPRGQEPGSSTGVALRWTRLVAGDRGALSLDLRRATSDRDTLYLPGRAYRSEMGIEGALRVRDGVVASAYAARGREGSAVVSGSESGLLLPPPRSRDQAGGRLDAEFGIGWGGVHARWISGEGWPRLALDAHLGVSRPGIGGVEAHWARESAEGAAAARMRLRGWSAPLGGVTFFASWEEGRAGSPPYPPAPIREEGGEGEGDGVVRPPLPPNRIDERSGLRGGASLAWRGAELWGAVVLVEADSLPPLGLPFDGGIPPLAGERRSGWEAGARIPLLLRPGLRLEGWTQQWEVGPDTGPWPWLPDRSYDARVTWHEVFLPSGNLEVHADVGVRGRDAMFIRRVGRDGEPVVEPVPFFQSWSARLQIRIVAVRVFIVWDNFTLRNTNQDLPGRILPQTRALYGVRWTLWN